MHKIPNFAKHISKHNIKDIRILESQLRDNVDCKVYREHLSRFNTFLIFNYKDVKGMKLYNWNELINDVTKTELNSTNDFKFLATPINNISLSQVLNKDNLLIPRDTYFGVFYHLKTESNNLSKLFQMATQHKFNISTVGITITSNNIRKAKGKRIETIADQIKPFLLSQSSDDHQKMILPIMPAQNSSVNPRNEPQVDDFFRVLAEHNIVYPQLGDKSPYLFITTGMDTP